MSGTWQFPLTVELGATAVRLSPGGSADVTVTIRNISQVVQHYEVIVLGLPTADAWHTDVPITKLRPGESGVVTLTIAPPRDAPLVGGDHVLGVLVRSPYDPSTVCRSEELTLSVETITKLAVAARPELVTGKAGGPFTVVLGNEGNTPLTVDLTAADDAGRARFRFTPPRSWVAPGTSLHVAGRVTAPTRITGAERRSQVTVTARVGRDTPGSARLTLVQPPLVPPTLFRVLGIVLAVAVVAASILVAAVLARPETPPPTTPPPAAPSAESTSSGASPPQAAQITISPDPPVVGNEVSFNATTSGEITAWLWTLTDDAANVLQTNQGTQQFRYRFDEAGTYVLHVAITSDGGTTTTTMTFQVQPAGPSVAQVTHAQVLGPDVLVVAELTCPTGKVALAGGVYLPPDVASHLRTLSSAPTPSGGWAFALRNQGSADDLTATLSATCAAPPEGLVVQRSPATTAPAGEQTLQATCPAGTVVLGGGGGLVVDPEHDQAVRATLVGSAPQDENGAWNGWQVAVSHDSEHAVEAVAVCAPQPPGFAVVVDVQRLEGTGTLLGEARCAAGAVLSGGASVTELTPGSGRTTVVTLDASAPLSVSGPDPEAQGWSIGGQYVAFAPLSLSTYAVCAALP